MMSDVQTIALTNQKQVQVVIVEDEPDIRKLYVTVFESEKKYKVYSADGKEQALALVDDNIIDKSGSMIWFLDWCIPPDNAIDLTRELLCRNIIGPFILVTAMSSSRSDYRCHSENIDEEIRINSPYRIFKEKLIKPVSVHTLLQTVSKHIL